MNLTQNSELLDHLAAAYALGTLRGGARRRFEQQARDHAKVRAAALLWQGRWSALPEMQTPMEPDPAVWVRISNQISMENIGATNPRYQESAGANAPGRLISWWRGAALAGALATVATAVVGLWSHQALERSTQQQLSKLETQVQTAQAALQAAPQIQYVAVLSDSKTDASMLVTFDPRHNQLVLQRVSGFQEAADRSLQLWALPPQGSPRSLGVMGQGKLERLTASEAEVQAIPTLAISLEPRGGVPSEAGPTGPVLFTGSLIRRDL